MVTKDDALKLALDAYLCREMPAGTVIGDPKWWALKIVAAIKEALEQPEQEPVAWATYCGNMMYYLSTQEPILDGCHSDIHNKPLYTTPPKRQPLTAEKRIEIMERLGITVAGPASDAVDALIKEVEAAHGIKE